MGFYKKGCGSSYGKDLPRMLKVVGSKRRRREEMGRGKERKENA